MRVCLFRHSRVVFGGNGFSPGNDGQHTHPVPRAPIEVWESQVVVFGCHGSCVSQPGVTQALRNPADW